MTYKVVLRQSEEGYSAHCPDLPGCWSQGATAEEALKNVREAIQEYLAAVDDLLKPEVAAGSPLDVEGLDLDVTTDEIVASVREGRREVR